MMRYDAFVSYSRIDGRRVRALRRGIATAGLPWRPWPRPPRLRLYLDAAAEGASSDLHASLSRSLDRSDWLIVVASPAAAASRHVNWEIEQWLARRRPDRILVAVLSGTPVWTPAGFAPGPDNPIPPALARVTRVEPGWTDLRGMRWRPGPRAAELAAPLLDVHKDQLVDEYRRGRRTARTVLAAAVVVVMALAGATVSFRSRADEQAAVAAAGRMLDSARSALAADPRRALRLAVAAHALDPGPGTRAGLVELLTRTSYDGERDRAGLSTVTAIADHPAGRWQATGNLRGEVRVDDRVVAAHGAKVTALAVTREGDRLFAGYADGTGVWVDPDGGSPTTRPAGPDEIRSARFGAGGLLATAAGDGVRLWDAGAREVHHAGNGFDDVEAVAFDVDQHLLHVARSGAVLVSADVTDAAAPVGVGDSTPELDSPASVIELSPDGRFMAAGLEDGGTLLWLIGGRYLGTPVELDAGEASALGFAPDGRTLAVGTATGEVRTWDLTLAAAPLRTAGFDTGDEAVTVVAAAPDHQSFTTVGRPDFSSWDTGRLRPPRRALASGAYEQPDSPLPPASSDGEAGWALALDPAGTRLVGVHGNGFAELWELAPGVAEPEAVQLTGPVDPGLSAVAWPASGRDPLAGQSTGAVVALPAGPPDEAAPVAGADGPGVTDLAVSSGTALSGGGDGSVSVWSVDPAGPVRRTAELLPPTGTVPVPLVELAGRRAVVSSRAGITVWDVADATRPKATVSTDAADAMALSPDGRSLVVADGQGTRLWDLTDPTRPRAAATLTRDVLPALVWGAHGLLVTTSGRNELALRDATDLDRPRVLLTVAEHTAPIGVAVTSADGRSLATTDGTGRIVVTDLTRVAAVLADPVAVACSAVGTGLDRAGWAAAAPVPYRATCR